MKKQQNNIQVLDIPFPDTTDLERQVLADVCVTPESMGDIITIVNADFFTNDDRADIWKKMVSEYNQGNSLEQSALLPKLGTAFQKEVIPGLQSAGGTISVVEHAVNLRNGAARRRAYFACAAFMQSAVLSYTTEQEILSSVEEFSRNIEGPAPLQGEKRLADVLNDVKAEIDKTTIAMLEGRNTRVPTGFRYLDTILNGGFKAGQLIILAARPSVGKTSVMLQMAKAAAAAGVPVQAFSMEMLAVELAEKLVYSTGQVRPYQVNFGCVNEASFAVARKELDNLPIYINDFSRSLDDIVSRLTQSVKKGRCGAAFIDYLGLFNDALNFGNAKLYQVIARVTGTLKAVAKRLEIPIILLCQLNRDAAREGRSPELYDLRDSGSIEQDADIVMMLENRAQQEYRDIVLWLRKHRGGKKEIGFPLEPNDTYSAFTEHAPILPSGSAALEALGQAEPEPEPEPDTDTDF